MDDHLRVHLRNAGFRPFDEPDWMGFEKVYSDEPWEYGDDNTLTIVDGTTVSVFVMEDDNCGPEYFEQFETELEAVTFATAITQEPILHLYVDRRKEGGFRLMPR